MTTIRFHHVDSFTTKPFEGNSTAAILNASELSDELMKKISIELQHSESSFLLPSSEANFKLRFFTKGGSEIKFCGHATIGALCALAKEKMYGLDKPQIHKLTIETQAGVLPIEVDMRNQETVYSFDLPKIELVPSPFNQEEVLTAFNIPTSSVDLTKPMMLEKTNNYIYITVKSLEDLKNIKVDFSKGAEFCRKNGIILVSVLTPHAFEKHNHVHTRGIAPGVDIPEDPFTGSKQGGLVAYLRANKMISKDLKKIGSEQGHFMGKPGEAVIEITQDDPIKARLYGHAKHLFSATLTI